MTSLLDDCSECEFLVSESVIMLFVTNVPRKPGQLSHRTQEDNFDPTEIKKEKLNLPSEKHKTLSLFVLEVNGEILSLLFPENVISYLITGIISVSVGNIFEAKL